ncbi:[FeFe] hydrogenase H-cluster maturation GTPase HydF [Paenibacillus helianthi]|uniref:[FeFe] hydrogenase H-cluster maturation GTPase HydF n=1 Tax=Paenibacillus helianthi TaxID=1349432 RepID=A0ABX3EI04_9BACL|nr:[FeFe] hydrogenase H-cluster maturation GTPase HydF [Paenibacillus helianthi]OKP79439.1 [FeFe] hydrogenase H-cluster maturation GTPase HydF [Paenibacillus helianthi]
MQFTPQSNKMHIAVFGKRNAGKSSLINALTGKSTLLVSDEPGTTAEPIFQYVEIKNVGTAIIVDTAGIDDADLFRVQKTREVMDLTDLGIMIFSDEAGDYKLEKEWVHELDKRNIPVIGVIAKTDDHYVDIDSLKANLNVPIVKLSVKRNSNLGSLRHAMSALAPAEFERNSIVGDLVNLGDLVVMVMPEMIPAPKYRLVASQQQILRDLLDHHAIALSVTEEELPELLARLNKLPDLVITDSQVFDRVNEIIPASVPLTTFAILMARFKGDLKTFVTGAAMISSLKPGDKVLLSEACIHHPHNGEIDRMLVKAKLQEMAGGGLDITTSVGPDFPDDVSDYKLIVHCGGCIFNRKQLMMRLRSSGVQNVPITNYGIAFAYFHGILPRVLEVLEVKA